MEALCLKSTRSALRATQRMGIACVALVAISGCAIHPQEPASALQVLLIGDSTMATRNGYGDALCAKFAPHVRCVNLAANGRSSMSFRAEGKWDAALALARQFPHQKTVMLIQFGHNDQPGKPGRSTDLATEFPVNIAQYVTDARATGAIPILLTPLTRRKFGQDGVLINDLALWGDAVREQATRTGTPLIDLNALSYAAIMKMGSAEADTLAEEPPPARPLPDGVKTRFDYTHLGAKGAAVFSSIVAAELKKAMPELFPA